MNGPRQRSRRATGDLEATGDGAGSHLGSADSPADDYERILTAVALGLERMAERISGTGVVETGSPDIEPSLPADVPPGIAERLGILDKLLQEVRRDLDSAATVQRMLLPKRSVIVNAAAHIAGYYRPLRGCGGDWWAAESLPGNRLLIAVGDVTGHGPAAAIMTGVVRAAFDAVLAMGTTAASEDMLKNLLQVMNRAVHNAGRGHMMMTCVISMVDTEAGQMLTANAGHIFPYVMTANADGSRELAQIMARGNPLGAQARIELDPIPIPVKSGDLVLWYTDGVTDCVSERNVPFGEKKLRALLRSAQANNAAQLRDRLIDELKQHSGGAALSDDMTLVVGYMLPLRS